MVTKTAEDRRGGTDSDISLGDDGQALTETGRGGGGKGD